MMHLLDNNDTVYLQGHSDVEMKFDAQNTDSSVICAFGKPILVTFP